MAYRTKMVQTTFDGELSDVEKHPRMLELAMRQRKQITELTAYQAQEYIRTGLEVRKLLEAEQAVLKYEEETYD